MREGVLQRRDFLRVAVSAALAAAAPRALLLAAGNDGAGSAPPRTATQDLDDLFLGLQLYWGDLHAHTGYSDGFGTPPALFDYARFQKGLHFCAITDHAGWINYFQAKLPMEDGSPVPLWSNVISEAEAKYAPGGFVTLPGLEWTSDDFGHRTVVFGSTARVPDEPPSAYTHRSPPELWAALEPYPSMTIPHHPTRWGRLMDWSYYNPVTDRLVEIYSKWGNGASVWTPYEPPTKYRQYPFLRGAAEPSGVDAMYERGHRLGIVAASDSHQGHPGSTAADEPLGTVVPDGDYPSTGEDFLAALEQGYTVDHREPFGGGGGLTGVWASELTRDAIWGGLYGRRTMGTSGARSIVKFGIRDGAAPGAGAVMGGELTVVGDPVLYASAVPEAGSKVTQIILLKTNEPILTVNDPAPGVAVGFRDLALAVGETACYRALILLRQQPDSNLDGDTVLMYDRENGRFFHSSEPRLDEQIWTSPVWATRVQI